MSVASKNLNTGKAHRCWRRSISPTALKKFCYTTSMPNCMKTRVDNNH